MSSLGERLRNLREKRNLKQNEVANKLGISSVNLSRYEKDKRTPSRKIIYKLAKFYEVSPSYLLFGSDEGYLNFLKDVTKEEAQLLEEYLRKIRGEKEQND